MDISSFLEAFSSSNKVSKTVGGGGGGVDDPSFLKGDNNSLDSVIQFNGDILNSFPISSDVTELVPTQEPHRLGSARLQISNCVNFGWAHQYYSGQLVSISKNKLYMAYGIHTPGKSSGVVRVVHRNTDQRVLLKNMLKGSIKDIAFSHSEEEIILGCVDEYGNLAIFKITQQQNNNDSLDAYKILEIDSEIQQTSEYHRLIWCPFLPEDNGSEASLDSGNPSQANLLVVTHELEAEMWNVDTVIVDYDSEPVKSSTVDVGRLKISQHSTPITDVCISPDGTALATASVDGSVKFFQVNIFLNEAPKSLHEWIPHKGSPVSSLFFLDNHRNPVPETQFWKFAITGCSNNTEFKIWCCDTWTCLQTIRLRSPDSIFKATLDLSAEYLLLSDIVRNNVYVFRIMEGPSGRMRIVSASEFATPNPFMCMAIIEAGVRRIKAARIKDTTVSDDEEDEEEEDLKFTGDNEGEEIRTATVITFYLVQPKSLQLCNIIYNDASDQMIESSFKLLPDQSNPVKSPLTANGNRKGKNSGGSSPSREVQDILFDANDELGGDVVITEEPYDDDDEEEEESEGEPTPRKPPIVDWPIKPAVETNKIKLNKSFDSHLHSRDDSSVFRVLNELVTQFAEQKKEITLLRQEVSSLKKANIKGTEDSTSIKPFINSKLKEHEKTVVSKISSQVKLELNNHSKHAKDSLSKMVHSKQVIDSIGGSVAAAARPAIQSAFSDIFSNVVIPAFDKSIQNLFVQLSGTFHKGLKDVEYRFKDGFTDVIANELKEMQANIMNAQRASLQEGLLKSIREVVSQELRNSAPNEIGSKEDPKQLVQKYISEINYEQAFQTALSANDLDLVLFTCNSISPADIFEVHPLPLSQSVLLSLIQQVSLDLKNETSIKRKYLDGAVMSLDSNCPATKHHMSSILQGLVKKLQNFQSKSEDISPSTRKSLKVLIMATQSVLNESL